MLAACPAHILPAIALMMFTGLGPRDALTLPRSFYKAERSRPTDRRPASPCSGPALPR